MKRTIIVKLCCHRFLYCLKHRVFVQFVMLLPILLRFQPLQNWLTHVLAGPMLEQLLATFPHLLFGINRFYVIFRIFYIKYHIICNQKQFYFFLIIWICFSFSCIIALARTSSTVFNRNGDTRHTCLVPDLRGKIF